VICNCRKVRVENAIKKPISRSGVQVNERCMCKPRMCSVVPSLLC
jgi:hypothetical protein